MTNSCNPYIIYFKRNQNISYYILAPLNFWIIIIHNCCNVIMLSDEKIKPCSDWFPWICQWILLVIGMLPTSSIKWNETHECCFPTENSRHWRRLGDHETPNQFYWPVRAASWRRNSYRKLSGLARCQDSSFHPAPTSKKKTSLVSCHHLPR